MSHGDHTLTIYFNDPVSDTNAASLCDAASHQAADLWVFRGDCHCMDTYCSSGHRYVPFKNSTALQKSPTVRFGLRLSGTNTGSLTMPFWTLKPSWNLRSGLLMRTVVTGGQLTMLSFTFTWFLRPWKQNTRGSFSLREPQNISKNSPVVNRQHRSVTTNYKNYLPTFVVPSSSSVSHFRVTPASAGRKKKVDKVQLCHLCIFLESQLQVNQPLLVLKGQNQPH